MNPWLIIAGILLIGAVLFYLQRRKKANQLPSHHIIQQDGFPDVHVPVALSRTEADEIARELRRVYKEAWLVITAIYVYRGGEQMPISVIGLSMDEIEPDHKHIRWIGDRIHMRYQEDMYFHFAGELHNMVRFYVWGKEGIGETQGATDAERAGRAQHWIDTLKG